MKTEVVRIAIVILTVLLSIIIGVITPPTVESIQTRRLSMDWQNVMNVVERFMVDVSMPLIVGLIGLDLALGVFEAIKRKVFEWGRVAEFYQTMVIPYVGGYLALNVAFSFLPSQLAVVLSPALSGAALAAILASLSASIMGHVKEIGFAPIE